MEAAPPTYEEATIVSPWQFIGPYLHGNDLCSAALVCSEWHNIFTPHIWGSPASHFGHDVDQIYTALIKFQATLANARLCIRALTHTLHVQRTHAEIYNVLHAGWLRDVLALLPRLQSLVVHDLPFFDYDALLVLSRAKTSANDNQADIRPSAAELSRRTGVTFRQSYGLPTFLNLRLLDASDCPNVTSTVLAHALGRLPSLTYLDLSNTSAARGKAVLDTFRRYDALQVLRLRGIGLRDADVEMLAKAIGLRVRSLDLRDNQTTEVGVGSLMEYCFAQAPVGGSRPQVLLNMRAEMEGIHQGAGFEANLHKMLTSGFIDRLAMEDNANSGITHLFISQNRLTAGGAAKLLRTARLHVLDIGTCCIAKQDISAVDVNVRQSASTHVVDALRASIATELRYLRIDHASVTAATDLYDLDDLDVLINALDYAKQDMPPAYEEVNSSTTDVTNVNRRSLHGHTTENSIQHAGASTIDRLRPEMLPRLQTLVLTDVPLMSSDTQVVDRITDLIKYCAAESANAHAQAKLDYTVPPGRHGHASTLLRSASEQFALKRIVLEMAPEQSVSNIATANTQAQAKSMTEDHDSEVLWSAAEDDFSFFRDATESINHRTASDGTFEEDSAADTRTRASGDRSREASMQPRKESNALVIDNIALLSAFRKERRHTHEQNVARGSTILTEGYWDGLVQIVRPPR